MNKIILAIAILIGTATSQLHADIVYYTLPLTAGGSRLVVPLQGKAKVQQGGNVTYQHPKFGSLVFALKDARIVKAPSTASLVSREISSADDDKECMLAANYALKNGRIDKVYEACKKAWEFNSNNAEARAVAKVKRAIDSPVPGDPKKQEEYMKKLVLRGDMNVSLSKHFILLHDTSPRPRNKHHKLPRAQERLELLENVYASFMLTFFSKGIELEVPKERLMVVLFSEQKDYLFYATGLSPSLASASGFYDGDSNVAFFYDHATDPHYQQMQAVTKLLQKQKELALKNRGPNAANIVRLADTLTLLQEIQQENSDIEVVSHECTHQMASNTGLLPRHVMIPKWAHEGLATYFETPDDAAWSGIGSVNEERLEFYRALSRDRVHSDIGFITSDEIFGRAKTHMALLHAYGQSWALTHFLMEKKFDKLIAYYRRIGEMPPDTVFSPEILKKVFNEVFGDDHEGLDLEWRAYMRQLRTSTEELLKKK